MKCEGLDNFIWYTRLWDLISRELQVTQQPIRKTNRLVIAFIYLSVLWCGTVEIKKSTSQCTRQTEIVNLRRISVGKPPGEQKVGSPKR